jgi:tetratricopeptide (TPR) repeat protein
MSSLTPPDSFYLESAKGWYLLGNLKEANAELDRLPAPVRLHPDVLEVRFAIYSRSRKWDACMDIAGALLGMAPERPTAWINSATVLHALNETRAAWDTLYNVMERFPKMPLIPYNLACYACVLGRIDESLKMLERAVGIGGKEMQEMAQEDPDLKPIWSYITVGEQRPEAAVQGD